VAEYEASATGPVAARQCSGTVVGWSGACVRYVQQDWQPCEWWRMALGSFFPAPTQWRASEDRRWTSGAVG